MFRLSAFGHFANLRRSRIGRQSKTYNTRMALTLVTTNQAVHFRNGKHEDRRAVRRAAGGRLWQCVIKISL